QAITLEVILRAVFGIEDADRLDHLRGGLNRLLEMGTQSRALAMIVIPPLRATAGRRLWERFQRLRAEVDQILYDEIAHRRAAADTADRVDVLSILLQARDEQGEPMTDIELRDAL